MMVHPVHGGYGWEVYLVQKEKLVGWRKGTAKTEHQAKDGALSYLHHCMSFVLLLSSVRYLTRTYWEDGKRVHLVSTKRSGATLTKSFSVQSTRKDY
jgi:hypothetical protein